MKLTQAYIERVRRASRDVQQLELAAVDDSLRQIRPGQTLLVRPLPEEDNIAIWDPYLHERWWPLGLTPAQTLLVERPATMRYEPGQAFSILGPLGDPYRFLPNVRNLLLMAYDGDLAPLTAMIPRLLHNQISVTLLLLGKARRINTDHLAPEVEILQGEANLDWPDPDGALSWADQIFVTVSRDDELMRFAEVLRFIRQRRQAVARGYLFGVFNAPWACGVGACMACALRTQNGLRLACTQGPAFDLTEVHLPE